MKSIVFALPGNGVLAKNIADAMQADMGEVVIRYFPDGEIYVRVLSEVKNRKVFLICTLSKPDEKLLPLYFLCKTIKSLDTSSVSVVAPYLSYMRQDAIFNPGEGITSEYFASLLSGFADSLITIDPHLHRRHSMAEIYSIPCTVIHASSLISAYINNHIPNPLLIGPDSESEQWVSEVAKNAHAPYVVLEKIRSGDKEVKITLPQLEKYKNHIPVLVDDIISTARTMIETVKHLKSEGMKPPICIGIHAVFSGDAFEELKKSGVSQIITCNTIPHVSNGIDVTALITENIDRKNKTELKSTITCPHCGHIKPEIMPTDTCQYFYECEHCKKVLKPRKGDCCVYCSYGTVKCPSKQTGAGCC
ncbi:MAG: ribose-phosphate pyrophosphokinase [Bacteroidetes bacterium]|nr:ribose-phosphate pyrophosphokinase [Bacteroidota bacterium]